MGATADRLHLYNMQITGVVAALTNHGGGV